ncbi:Transport permease protein [Candidatus Desulfarcum epimagneticum]|uniref:Transport permease protein n=1 Tax=uncultured Desulfobacteraceae bacterium TaxID=218296 RepID=A0A484HES4_9BACT|nr:Transport permease protein [uncultured Desulfobacteraceae bacterium]
MLLKNKSIMKFLTFISPLFTRRYLILEMAKREILSKHIGSFLGFAWTFIHPVSVIFIFWMVFGVGFKTKVEGDIPFSVWLVAGMCAWQFFSEIISDSAQCVISSAHLVKKTVFPSQVLPLVVIFKGMAAHLAFLLILLIFLSLNGMPFGLCYLQFFYYLFAASVLAMGVGWMAAGIAPFFRDLPQIVSVAMRTLFWFTPIVWNISIMPEKIKPFFYLNPVYYLVRGYRDSFITFVPFWAYPLDTAFYWAFALSALCLGAFVFKRLQPHFPDVL